MENTQDQNKLEERQIEVGTAECDAFVHLNETAFPAEECIESSLLLEGLRLPGFSCTAYYDEGDFCGFTYEIELEHYLYLLLFAVSGKVRSRGYGSRMLAQVRKHAGHKPVVLDIEPLDSMAPNAEQRVKRLKFYERNGFANTGHSLVENGVLYTVLATDGFRDMIAFKEEFDRVSPGIAGFDLVSV